MHAELFSGVGTLQKKTTKDGLCSVISLLGHCGYSINLFSVLLVHYDRHAGACSVSSASQCLCGAEIIILLQMNWRLRINVLPC